ncbi:uncharacterized protein LOC115750090 isoform X2 [Rhodamnia argentea]|uniref:Uncharacterized protein LOC115750090 isoform X2 n=1 Tax=Rhodamnia argentea TaxID=178133 RepID=A0A8B8Q9B6_9MYRT|nr:uncharacterized protein LOC115750090 isoform X2 [Rhodamnia argentea]
MATADRESRRRRIVGRSSDRLALITGRIQSLPSSDSSQPSIPGDPDPSPLHPDRSNAFYRAECQAFETVLPKDHQSGDASETDGSRGRENMEFASQKSQTSNQCSEAPPSEISEKSVTYSSSASHQNASRPTTHVEQPSVHQALRSTSISPNQISSAIDSSVTARLLCAVVVGLLVVLSDIGFPLLGNKIIRSVLMSRPLYLVLLTNVTLVLAPLVLDKQSTVASTVKGENKNPSAGESDWADQVGNSLELGFLMMKVMDAVIMDCSFYSVVVVGGLSLTRIFT